MGPPWTSRLCGFDGTSATACYTAQAPRPRHRVPLGALDGTVAVLCGLAVLVVYGLTLPHTVTGEDSGELIAAAYTLGIAHPPGYPLWCLMGKLACGVPLGNVAERVAGLSACLGAFTVGLACLLGLRLGAGRLGSATGALALGFSAEFWEQSVIAEVYTLNAFLTVLCLLFLAVWHASRRDRWLYAFALAYGLGLCNHHTMALLGPVFVAFVLMVEPYLTGAKVTVWVSGLQKCRKCGERSSTLGA